MPISILTVLRSAWVRERAHRQRDRALRTAGRCLACAARGASPGSDVCERCWIVTYAGP